MSLQMHFQDFSTLPVTKQDEHQRDISPVHMLTIEIPVDSTNVSEFRKATSEDTISVLSMQAVMDVWLESRKDCHPLLLDSWIYKEEIGAENGLLFKVTDSPSLKSFITELFRPSMKVISVLQRCH